MTPRRLTSLSLFPGEPRPPAAPGDGRRERCRQPGRQPDRQLSRQLWLAVCLPELSSPSRQATGTCLSSLAIWSKSLTPLVSLEPPDGLLLEVQGSLGLFGGIENIKTALAAQIEKRGRAFRLSVAPTSRGALWLARHTDCDAFSHDELARRLRGLPLGVTGWPDKIRELLASMGVTHIGECLRLPRDGLARRIGTRFVRDLDKALGKAADPRLEHEAPRIFTRRVELTVESADLGIIADAAETLIGRMTRELRGLQKQVVRFGLKLHHLRREPTVERFELIEPSHEAERFLNLLVDRLERMQLPAPVIALEIETDALRTMHLVNASLLTDCAGPGEEEGFAVALVERLRERFGPCGVCRLGLVADHRPEWAWAGVTEMREIPARAAAVSPWAGARPLWLLRVPQPLRSANGRPFHGGPLEIEAGPERIESGWWAEADIRRDYYTAQTRDGRKVWIYLDRASGQWCLHGIFG